MGTCFAGLCHDCKESVDLDKFYSFCPIRTLADLEVEDLSDYGESFVYRSLRLHLFMEHHKGHRLGVYRDSDAEYENAEDYEATFHWPEKGCVETDIIDLRDKKTPRVILQTMHGDLYIDNLGSGVNCFRFEDGSRIDTLLLKANPNKSIGQAILHTKQQFVPENPYY